MVLHAGRLNRRVILERRQEVVDKARQSVSTFVHLAEVWAAVEPVAGSKSFGDQQFVATSDLRITIRWRADVNPLHQVTIDGFPHEVLAVAEEGHREALLITVRGRAERRP